ncbi:glycosyltransferase family 2 protein [Aquilutibacter rugosus]
MITAIVVTYHPEPKALVALLGLLAAQADAVLVVDNGSPDEMLASVRSESPSHIEWIANERNVGLGQAINLGVECALANGSDAFVLFDQDSTPSKDLIATLDKAYWDLSASHWVGAVGPAFADARSGKLQPFVRIGFPLNTKIVPQDEQPVQCDYLITSGCYIPAAVWNDVGPLDASLFIDNLDMDWSFRARAKGYALFGIPSAVMDHAIGDRLIQLPMNLGDVMVHSPKRLYFSSRNRVLLYRRPHVSATWVAQDIPRFALKFLRLAVLVKPRRQVVRAMLLGLFDGLAGRSGEPRYRFD